MVVYEKFFKNILKYLKEMKKYVSKLILYKNIINRMIQITLELFNII